MHVPADVGSLFKPGELDLLAARGIDPEAAVQQIEMLRNPPPAVVLDRPATLGDGIEQIARDEQTRLLEIAETAAREGRVMKFVPASGAASRMFADLVAALREERLPSRSTAARTLFERLDELPFAVELRRRSGVGGVPRSEEEERRILRTLLHEMGYAHLPKALIPFHGTDDPRTPFEEQLLEGTRYCRSEDGTCAMHFTVAPELREEFERNLAALRPKVERATGAVLAIGFSEQHPATDTLAIDEAGAPFRSPDGKLLFRPGGHGSLLRNLEELRGDVVVIRNIDNILPFEASGEVVHWKRLLIGLLLSIQSEAFELLAACEREQVAPERIEGALAWISSRFGRLPAAPLRDLAAKRRFVIEALDRPLRVCGVVRNEGEPGGAPFWVRSGKGTSSLQIVEASQIDPGDRHQMQIFRASTHFNPVDIVCGLRSWKGEPFELERFVDPSTVFVAKKSHEGRELTALERPGLWNGAMAHWNTVCVEVPATTFAPVKTVLDLLRPEHRRLPAG